MQNVATTPALPAVLAAYLSNLPTKRDADGVLYYTAKAVLLYTKPSTIIHSDATTTPSTFSRYEVYLETANGYQASFHYVGIDALGRLVGVA